MTVRFVCSLEAEALARLAATQANNLFPDADRARAEDLATAVAGALARLEHCFSKVGNKYFFDGSQARFDHLHGDQYAMWLYFLANEAFRQGAPASLCKKLFLLNKTLHGCDIFYEVELPSVFLLVHPLGTVLGRARYSDYFVAYQRCGVGSNRDSYPSFREHETLRRGSAVLGSCRIGHYCQIAAESLIMNRDLPDHSLYIGNPQAATIKRQEAAYPLWRMGAG